MTGIETEPMISAEGPNDTGEPETMIPGAPGVSIEPATDIPVGSCWNTSPLRVVTCPVARDKGGRVICTEKEPTTRLPEPRAIGVPDTVIGGAPAEIVVPAIEMASPNTCTMWLSIVAA